MELLVVLGSEGLLSRPLAGRVIETIKESLADADGGNIVVNHGDLHPGNLLRDRRQLTAEVDWSHTRLGPRWWEVAYFRIEAAVLTDASAVDPLLSEYETIIGFESPDQPVCDLLCVYNGHRWDHLWLRGSQEQGRRNLTQAVIKPRLTRLAARALGTLRRVRTSGGRVPGLRAFRLPGPALPTNGFCSMRPASTCASNSP